jgi:hypothetical protein
MSSKRWFIPLCSFFSIAGLAGSLSGDFLHILSMEMPGSDYKTVWASSKLMLHAKDAYSITNIGAIYSAAGISKPLDWFGHMPVYPPFTMALLQPFGALGLSISFAAWMTLSCLLWTAAVTILARAAHRDFHAGATGQLLVIALCAIYPLTPFAMEMGNCSLIVSALSIIALMGQGRPWTRWASLGVALLLKPHLALWALVALLLSSGTRGRSEARRAVYAAAAIAAATTISLASRGLLVSEWRSYFAMLRFETGTGSMSIFTRESLPTVAQITSVGALTGWFSRTAWLPFAVTVIVTSTAAAFLTAAAVRSTQIGMTAERRTLIAGACISLGMIATYHRAHDAVLLLILAPWGVSRILHRWRDWRPWAVIVPMTTVSCAFGNWHGHPWLGPLGPRQAAAGMLILTVLLLGILAENVRLAAPAFAARTSFRISWKNKSLQESSVVTAHIQHHQAGRRS